MSTGDSMEASILVVLNLQSVGVKNIWVKAISEAHERVLYKLGVPFVVFPEAFVAFQLAHRLAAPGLHEYFGLGKDVATREIVVEQWAGKTLRELDLTNRYQVQVIAFRHNGESEFRFVPQADRWLVDGDVLVPSGQDRARHSGRKILGENMSGNTFGTVFRLTTFGESHGPGLGGVVDGCPAGIRWTSP